MQFSMKLLLTLTLLILEINAQAQPSYNFDSLTTRLCVSFKKTATLPDSIRVDKVFEKHSEIFQSLSSKDAEGIYAILYMRLQMLCSDFDRVTEVKSTSDDGDGVTVTDDIPSNLPLSACSAMFNVGKFYYLQGGEAIGVILTDSTWTSLFPDGTTSLLNIAKENQCEFVATFAKSDNYIIKNVLQRGYQFRYRIIDEYPLFYSVVAEDIGTKKKQLFKLYK